MPRSRFCPRLPALALGVTLVLGFASAAAVAQTGVAQIEADGMPLRLVYPTAARARPMASGPFNLSVAPAAPEPATVLRKQPWGEAEGEGGVERVAVVMGDADAKHCTRRMLHVSAK